MILRCRIYHRSCLAEDEEGALERLRQAAADRGWTVEAEHVDRQDRPRDDRPAFEQLAAALERGAAGPATLGPGTLGPGTLGLVTLGLDRLFPSRVPAALGRLAGWLRGGVRVLTLEPPVDTAEPVTWARVLGVLAELPRRQRSEATAAGHALRARAGLVERNVWNDPEIRRRYRAGESQRSIARALGVWQSSLCLHLRDLRTEGYLGERDEKARGVAHRENPPNRGGRPRKSPAEVEA